MKFLINCRKTVYINKILGTNFYFYNLEMMMYMMINVKSLLCLNKTINESKGSKERLSFLAITRIYERIVIARSLIVW